MLNKNVAFNQGEGEGTKERRKFSTFLNKSTYLKK